MRIKQLLIGHENAIPLSLLEKADDAFRRFRLAHARQAAHDNQRHCTTLLLDCRKKNKMMMMKRNAKKQVT